MMRKISVILLLICVVILNVSLFVQADDASKSEKIPLCQSCKKVVKSFEKGIEKTSRGKYEGGDTDWEERKLGSYANSEIRLVEIQEDLCKDMEKEKDKCHLFAEENEEHLEKWWLHDQNNHPDLFTYLCIDQAKVCCPNNTYGPECNPCPGGIDNPCTGNGKCRGAGTRKGSGKCMCNKGYSGDVCDQCAVGYYQSLPNSNKLVCLECHKSCQDRCWEGGPKGCEVCKSGWIHSPESGCQDVNECAREVSPCTKDEFCVNVEGSYQCIECHKSCDGCNGDGPDMCIKCKENNILKDGICIDSDTLYRSWKIQVTRYVTYIGLCIATFIIFKKNNIIAALVGIVVAIYIAASEYTILQNSEDMIPTFS